MGKNKKPDQIESRMIEIRITNVSHELRFQLNNIADHLGVPLGHMLKPKLREIADSYPDDMKKPITKE